MPDWTAQRRILEAGKEEILDVFTKLPTSTRLVEQLRRSLASTSDAATLGEWVAKARRIVMGYYARRMPDVEQFVANADGSEMYPGDAALALMQKWVYIVDVYLVQGAKSQPNRGDIVDVAVLLWAVLTRDEETSANDELMSELYARMTGFERSTHRMPATASMDHQVAGLLKSAVIHHKNLDKRMGPASITKSTLPMAAVAHAYCVVQRVKNAHDDASLHGEEV